MDSIGIRAKLALVVAGCVLAVGWALAGAGFAKADQAYGSRADAPSSAQKIGVFEDVVIDAGETWENVVVVGGDATVSGTVENMVVVVGGDASIRSGARGGGGEDPDETAVVVVFGDVLVEDGAVVTGDIFRGMGAPPWLGAATISPDYESWSWGSLAGWIALVVFLTLVAVVAAVIAPRQVAFVRERIRHHFFSSLRWGALLVIVGVPLVSIVLIVTLVGILVLVPWLGVVVPVIWLFGFVSLGAMLGRLILRERPDERGPLMAAAALGVAILSLLWWIPVAGGVILFLLGLVGFGATCISMWEWGRRSRRGQQNVPGGGYPAPPAPPVPPVTVPAPPDAGSPAGFTPAPTPADYPPAADAYGESDETP